MNYHAGTCSQNTKFSSEEGMYYSVSVPNHVRELQLVRISFHKKRCLKRQKSVNGEGIEAVRIAGLHLMHNLFKVLYLHEKEKSS